MRVVTVFGLLLWLTTIAIDSHAQTDAQRAVSQAIEAFRVAALANDADKLGAVLTDDCTAVVGPGLLVTKSQLLSAVRDGSVVFDAMTFEDVVVRIYGDTAVVTHVMNLKERLGGKPAESRVRTTRVLVKTDRGWRIVAFQNTAM